MCRFGDKCFNIHPSNYCKLAINGEVCSLGRSCLSLHPRRVCRYWRNGFCKKSEEECGLYHDSSLKGSKASENNKEGCEREVSKSNYGKSDYNKSSYSFLDSGLETLIMTQIHTAINKWKSYLHPYPIQHQNQTPPSAPRIVQFQQQKPHLEKVQDWFPARWKGQQ